MAQSTFVVGAVTVPFNWLDRGPVFTKQNNTDVYSGRILLRLETDVAALSALMREISVEAVDASAGTNFIVDYNGTTDPSGTLTMADGVTTVNCVLTRFSRTVFNIADFHEVQAEFTRVS